MVQDFTAFRKISFQTVDVEVALAEIEYQYLKFVCEATLRNSDEVLREQIRHLHIAGLPSFDEWRKQEIAAVRGILSPSIEAKTIPTTAIESHEDAVEATVTPTVETPVEPATPAVSEHPSSQPSNAKTASAKQSGSATDKLLKVMSDQATAKLTSRTVIEQQHELLTAMLKEGKSYDDLAEILTSNGAKISASTLRNYLSAARRLAKTGRSNTSKANASKKNDATASTIAEPATDDAVKAPVEPSSSETNAETTPAPAKPTRGRPKAAAKAQFERETSVTSGRALKAVPEAPALKRRKTKG